jgi:hypothetical protein
MMQWVPYGAYPNELGEHMRTFASVFPHVEVIQGPGRFGVYMLGSEEPLTFEPEAVREVLSRPGVLEDISSAYDSPETTIEGWVEAIEAQRWLNSDTIATTFGDGPLITDDHPRPEYFLLRRMGQDDQD